MLQLQRFTEADFQQIIDWISNATFAFQWAGPAFTYPITPEQLTNYVNDEANVVLKAIDNETMDVIGHVAIGRIDAEQKTGRIGKVLIGAKVKRGQGYGTQLMQAAVTYAFEQLHLQTVTLGVFDFNKQAIACYEKVGFMTTRVIPNARTYNGEQWTLIEMEKSCLT